MKISSSFLILSLGVTSFVACAKKDATPAADAKATAQNTTATTATTNAQTVKTEVISVPTAKCENCAHTITAAVEKVNGVEGVKVDPETKKAEVKFIEAKTNLHEIENAISLAGYTANSTQRDTKAYNNLESCCK